MCRRKSLGGAHLHRPRPGWSVRQRPRDGTGHRRAAGTPLRTHPTHRHHHTPKSVHRGTPSRKSTTFAISGPALRFRATMMIASNLGFPPLGATRELKRATEGYWSGKVSREQLLATAAELRQRHWRLQGDIGLDHIPANDFSFYDRMLDTCAMVGAVPPRYEWKAGSGREVDLDTYFAMARGSQGKGRDVTAMEMTKWFDTNYHYIVPELERGQTFQLSSAKAVDQYREAKALGIEATPVLIGPITFLLLAKAKGSAFDRLDLLDALLPVYAESLSALASAGASWIQLDEPVLALDRTETERAAFVHAYGQLSKRAGKARLWVAPSCSLLHTPLDLDLETKLDPELKTWLAFSKQKLQEVVALAKGDRAAIAASGHAVRSRRTSKRINNAAVQGRAGAVTEQDRVRRTPYAARRKSQVELPPYPTTTIGSFPQTAEVRAARRKLNDNQLSAQEYDRFIEAQIGKTITLQEELGLDVLVHGEFERNDMVEYFGEQLAGFAFTEHGWVQSFGTRYEFPV